MLICSFSVPLLKWRYILKILKIFTHNSSYMVLAFGKWETLSEINGFGWHIVWTLAYHLPILFIKKFKLVDVLVYYWADITLENDSTSYNEMKIDAPILKCVWTWWTHILAQTNRLQSYGYVWESWRGNKCKKVGCNQSAWDASNDSNLIKWRNLIWILGNLILNIPTRMNILEEFQVSLQVVEFSSIQWKKWQQNKHQFA